MSAVYEGEFGRAELLRLPDVPAAAATLCIWLISSRLFHPMWNQYTISVVRLVAMDDFPPPYLRWEGATHEMFVLSVNPEAGYVTQKRLAKKWTLQHLRPANFIDQFEATDAEMAEICELMAHTVVTHGFTPEGSSDPAGVAEMWLGSAIKTLAHLRGEVHAS